MQASDWLAAAFAVGVVVGAGLMRWAHRPLPPPPAQED